MKKCILFVLLATLPLFAEVKIVPEVCTDSLYLALRGRPVSSLTGGEVEYVNIKQKECEKANQSIKTDKSVMRGLCLAFMFVSIAGLIVTIIALPK